MGHYRVSKKVRRKKVADLAAKSRMYSVNNCTIQHIDNNTETVTGEDGRKYIVGKVLKWKKEHHVQPKRLRKTCWKVYFAKEEHDYLGTAVWVRHAEKMKSEYPQVSSTKLTRAELIEGLIKEKIKKWELKHPCPAKDDDLFKEEFIPKWKAEKQEAKERIEQHVSARYDNDIRLNAKYENTAGYTTELVKMKNKEIAEVTDKTSVNELDPKTSKLIKKAKKITNAEKKRNPKLTAAQLLDMKQNKGRIILPDSETKQPWDLKKAA